MDWVVFWSEYISNMIRVENQNFLYFLHEEDKFDCSSLSALCQYLAKLETISLGQVKDLYFIREQILKHLVDHVGSKDLYTIFDLPSDYWEYLDHMGLEIKKLSVRLEQTLEVKSYARHNGKIL